MREKLARAVAVIAVASLVALSIVFAEAQNPLRTGEPGAGGTGVIPRTAGPEAPSVDTLKARALFAEVGCGGCHTVGALGSPRNPLDGIGSRRTLASIRAWTIGEGAPADSLSPAVLRVKRTYAELSEADLAVLTAWLAGLKEGV